MGRGVTALGFRALMFGGAYGSGSCPVVKSVQRAGAVKVELGLTCS